MKNLEFIEKALEKLDINPEEMSKREMIESLKEALEDADEIEFAKFEDDMETLKLFHPNLFHQLSDSISNPFRETNEEGE